MNHEETIQAIRQKLRDADAILLGAGAGLSTAAGLVYDGEDFHKYFQDFIDKYHFENLYEASFGDFESSNEKWAFWSRFIQLERYQPGPLPLYQKLRKLVEGKEYFVLTTNVDHCFQKAGFPKERLFYTQGDYGLFQCSTPCHQKTYDNEEQIHAMLKEQKALQIPTPLIPKCPICGKEMSLNLRTDNTFVEDVGWHQAEERYELFLANHYSDEKIVYLELGVGNNSPAVIKLPFMRLTLDNPQATYIRINLAFENVPLELEPQSLLLKDNLNTVIDELLAS